MHDFAFESPVSLLLIGDWEVDPEDDASLASIGPVALRVGEGGDSEFIQVQEDGFLRLRLRHRILGSTYVVRPSFSASSPELSLTVSFTPDASSVRLSTAGGQAILRRIPHVQEGSSFWRELSDGDRQQRRAQSRGSLASFLGPAVAAFAKSIGPAPDVE